MIIGITGPAGAGKDSAAAYISEKLSIPHISGGDIIREMLRGAGLEPTKTAVVNFGVYLRANYGLDAVARRAIEKADGNENFIYSGFRSIPEAEVAKNEGKLVYIDAPDELRYERIANRSRNGDALNVGAMKLNDAKEVGAKAIESENLEEVKLIADIIIINDGTVEEFHAKLDDLCASLNLSEHRVNSYSTS